MSHLELMTPSSVTSGSPHFVIVERRHLAHVGSKGRPISGSLGDQQETAVPRGCHLIHIEEVAGAEADPG